jgi:hypothetical protein
MAESDTMSTNHMRLMGRARMSTKDAVPNRSIAARVRRTGDASINAVADDHTAAAAATSMPFGVAPPVRNKAIGVSATSRPNRAMPPTAMSEAQAMVSSAAQRRAASTRMR